MKYSILGQAGVRVSQIALGTAAFGVAPRAEGAGRIVGAALDLGLNFCRYRRRIRQLAGIRSTRSAASRRSGTG